MIFNKKYNRWDFIKLIRTKIFPNFVQDIQEIDVVRKTKFAKNWIFKLWIVELDDIQLDIWEVEQITNNDSRVTLTKEAFKLLNDYQKSNILVVFWNKESSFWRFSLLTSNYDKWLNLINSNPKRYSFLLWEWEKTKTPERYLIDKWIIKDFNDLISRFDVEIVNNEFFNIYINLFFEVYNAVRYEDTLKYQIEYKNFDPLIFSKNLMGKLIFLYFIQKKWWLWLWENDKFEDHQWNQHFFKDQLGKYNNYYNDFLKPLFYTWLNSSSNTNSWHKELQMKIPYLNGWLFQEEYDGIQEDQINLPNKLFESIIDTFDTYNFTIDENDPMDQEIAIDPEMLGKIFEYMISFHKNNIDTIDKIWDKYYISKEKSAKKYGINISEYIPSAEFPCNINFKELIKNIDSDKNTNKKLGAFYTPKPIVSYMTKESIKQYLIYQINDLNSDKDYTDIIIDMFIRKDAHLTKDEIYAEKQIHYDALKAIVIDIMDSLTKCKILDPAVWSGAFPMGILQEIYSIKKYLMGIFEHLAKVSNYDLKLEIISTNIYGVDIDPGAIDISRLRFWLTLILESPLPLPLPNLDFKFVCANSLINLEKDTLFTNNEKIKKLHELQKQYFSPLEIDLKDKIKNNFQKIKWELEWYDKMITKAEATSIKEYNKIAEQIMKQSTDKKNNQFREWEPFNISKSNSWFDSEIMFDIDKFDIVIGNPPYVQTNKWIFSKDIYPYSEWKDKGKQNLYKIFTEMAYNITKKWWVITYILQSSLMCDVSSQYTRELLLTKTTIKEFIEFPKKSKNKEWQVFDTVLQWTCIFQAIKKFSLDDHIFRISVDNNASNIQNIEYEYMLQNKVMEFYPNGYYIPLVKKWEINIIIKIRKNTIFFEKLIKEISQWDLNLTSEKAYFGENKTPVKLYRWKNIHRFCINNDVSEYIQDNYKSNISKNNLNVTYLICQQITWTVDKYRLHFAINDKVEFLLWNSVNKVELHNSNYIYILGLLNSKLLDWFFRKTSTNNHVNGYEVEQLPIRLPTPTQEAAIVTLVDKILSAKKLNPKADTSNLEREIDQLVYILYELTDEEIAIVEDSIKG